MTKRGGGRISDKERLTWVLNRHPWLTMSMTSDQKFCEGWQTANEDLTDHYGYRIGVGSGTPTIERVTCQVVPQVERVEVVK